MQPDAISKLVVVDTSPDWGRDLVKTKFPDYISAMKNVTMNPKLTLSQVRQSVANQLEPIIQVKKLKLTSKSIKVQNNME